MILKLLNPSPFLRYLHFFKKSTYLHQGIIINKGEILIILCVSSDPDDSKNVMESKLAKTHLTIFFGKIQPEVRCIAQLTNKVL